jgi:perosamine synthetase
VNHSPIRLLEALNALRPPPLPAWPILEPDDIEAGHALLRRLADPSESASHLETYNGQGITKEFESSCVDYFKNSKYCIATGSGYSALVVALLGMGIEPGDEVIVPALSYGQAISPLLHLGARIVFADVQPSSMNLCPESTREKITARTKAILLVHVNGNPCDMQAFLKLSDETGIPLIEDACQSLGATYRGEPVGQFGAVGCFSTGAPKQLSVGTGGFLITNDKDIYKRGLAKGMRYGRMMNFPDTPGLYDDSISYTNDIAPVTAALAMSRMKSLSRRNEAVIDNVTYLRSLLNIEGLEFVGSPAGCQSVFFRTSLRLDLERLGGLTIKEFKSLLVEGAGLDPGCDFAHAIYPLYKTQRMRDLFGEHAPLPVSEAFHQNTFSFRSIRWQTPECRKTLDQYAALIRCIFDHYTC